MPEVQPSAGGKAPVIDDDTYIVTCVETKLITVEEDQFDNFHKVDVFLEIEGMADEDGEPIVLKPRINQAWSEKATLFKYALAFGLDVDPTRSFNTDLMHGLRAQAQVKTAKPGDWPRVKALMPLPKAQRTVTRQPVRAAASLAAPGGMVPVLNPDGTLNTATFWKETRRLNLTRDEVIAEFNGDVNNIIQGDPVDVADWLDIKRAVEPDDLPFDQ